MRFTPKRAKRLLSLYPPYLGAGIRITSVDESWREMNVAMKLRWYNRNMFGVHFGGSLSSMVDPHYAIMLTHILGKEYIVWDKYTAIDFVRPGTGTVTAKFTISDEQIEDIKVNTADGRKYLPHFKVSIINSEQEVVANAEKTLYVRKKKT